MVQQWTMADIPSQEGKIVIVTGATGGLGYETALFFAEAGAIVIAAGRNEAKGAEALKRIRSMCSFAKVVFGKVDLCSLASVKEFCEWFHNNYQVLDVLVNNAAVMSTPTRETTKDGFEMKFGTNHLAHFALTAQLLPALQRSSRQPRVVSVASAAANYGKIDFDDLEFQKSFKPFKDYGTTKLANLLFTLELQRRSDAHGWGLMVNAAHPGGSTTEGAANAQKNMWWFTRMLISLVSHSASDGALCTMYAATALDAENGGYYGPQGFLGATGPPGRASVPKAAKDIEVAKRLWEVSETLTGVIFPTGKNSDDGGG